MKNNNILNKQIEVRDIIEAAEVLERCKDEWKQKFAIEESKNRDLDWEQKNYTYYSGSAEIKYTISLKDGNTLTETSFEWFAQNLSNTKIIDNVYFYLNITFWTKQSDSVSSFNSYEDHNRIYVNLYFGENNAYIETETSLQENEGKIIYNSLIQIFDKCKERHDSVIKHKGRIMQSYCMAIGIIITYLLFGAYKIAEMNGIKIDLSFIFNGTFDVKIILIIGQLILALVIGNIFANRAIYNVYKPIIPDTKYMGYDYAMNSGIYRDDVQEFKRYSEVHIGKYYDAVARRKRIKRKYAFAKVIIFLQLIAIVIIYFH